MFNSSSFSLDKAIDRHPLMVTPDTPVISAIALMSQARSSCVLVVTQHRVEGNEPGRILGIFTERDVVRVIAVNASLEDCQIAQVMTGQPITLTLSGESDIITVLNLFRQNRFRHLPVVDGEGRLLGIITHHGIREVLKPADWMRLRQITEVMTTQVVNAPLTASVLAVTQLMAKERVSCVVITGEMELGTDEQVGGWVDESVKLEIPLPSSYPPSLIPVGIITERDIVQFRVLGLDFGETQAQTVMSTPLLPIGPLDSLWAAHELMQQHHIRRLVVVGEAGQLVGIVTQTSLLRSLDPIETSASITALQQLVEERTKEFWQAYKGLQCEIRQHRQTAAALRESQARLIGILDIAEDAIISIDENQRIQLFNQGAEKIFGYAASEILFHPIDLLLPNWLKAAHPKHIGYSDSTDVTRMGERQEIGGRRKDGTEFPAEVSISLLKLGQETILTAILRDITERKRAEEALQNQIARERLLGAIASRIRQSLDLDTILKTTVEEVQQFLGCDRVIIYHFSPDCSGVVVVESVSSKWLPIIGSQIKDDCFTQDYLQLYQNGRIKATEDIHTAKMHPCYVDLLKPFQIRANLIVPILLSSSEFRVLNPENKSGIVNQSLETKQTTATGHSEVWGLLSAHQCSGPRRWQDWEIELLQQLATQVAIAIQQAELYQQLLTANQQLQQLASLDGLTQVANRRRFDEYFHQEWRRLARDREPLSLILCDVDCFKAYNDTYGHLEGDTCLQQVASAIRAALKRPADLVARYGGEEFAVVLPNTPAEGATRVALEIQSTIRALKIDHSKSFVSEYLTISLGVASTIPSHLSSEAMLIAVADKALYQAKAQGRDRFVLQEFNRE